MPPRAQRRTAILAGCWLGSATDGAGASRDLLWALAMTPGAKRSSVPTVFGGGPGGRILRGSWDADSRVAHFTEHDVKAPTATLATYRGRVSADGTALSGTFDASAAGSPGGGTFACTLETSIAGSEAGLFVGALEPEGEFAEFIPTNPLLWALAVLTPEAAAAAGPGVPRVFGGGFFSDAGDVADHPVLFFALESSPEEDGERGASLPPFRKTYEQLGAATDGAVAYSGCALEREEGSPEHLWLRGAWANEAAGTHGRFAARRHPSGVPFADALVLCARCSLPIWPGEPRWACERSAAARGCPSPDQPWAVCFRDRKSVV